MGEGCFRPVREVFLARASVLKKAREAQLHETMYAIAGGRHTFANFPEGKEPKTVLDVSIRSISV